MRFLSLIDKLRRKNYSPQIIYIRLKKYFTLKRLRNIFASIIVIVIIFNFLFPLPDNIKYSKVIYSDNKTLLAAYLSSDDKWRLKTEADEVSPYLIKALIEKEDNWFYYHPGINPVSVIRAFFQNIISGERVSGASTITMQLARMLDPSERNYFNKIKEMLRAMQLELNYSKNEILGMYISLLPYGGNVEGVKAASYIYFNRPPSKLSLSQSVVLTIIPNNPNNLRIDRNIKNLVKSRNRWITKFKKGGIFESSILDDAREEPLTSIRYSIPVNAPHFSQVVAERYSGDNIYTTLNYNKQKIAEKLLMNYVQRIKNRGISNGAVLVINNKNNAVTAYCGSADFNDNSALGQVNGVIALRSPGSTLKPLLFARAMDIGILTPKMIIPDVPTDFNGYQPENFDMKYNGPVTAEYALLNSLNIPSVKLLKDTGLDRFLEMLIKTGFTDVQKRKNKLGLSVILGGCGVRLEQLATAYSAFAHRGIKKKLNYLKNETKNDDSQINIFSEESAYIISSILNSNQRPDYPAEFLEYTKLPKIAWKTGTSYGKRDAWAVGYNPDYTIAVWLGNFNGKGAPELTGADIAVPLLFELFNSIDYNPKKKWFRKPENVYTREVCAKSGLLPGELCGQLVTDYFIENTSHNSICELEKSVYTDSSETIQYCPSCLPETGYKKSVYAFYEPEVTLWYYNNNINIKLPPPHNPECQVRKSGKGPKILSPLEDYEYLIEENSGQQILLQAASEPSVKCHFWYLNNRYYGKTKPGEKLFFKPAEGKCKIVCLDDAGRSREVTVTIRIY